MHSTRMTCGALLLVLGAGCSSDPVRLPDAASYAQDVKQEIHTFVRDVGGNPKLAREQGAVLAEKLEVYQTQPVGEHGPIYGQMLEKVRELARGQRDATAVNRLLTQLRQLADRLPGEVKLPPPDSD